MNVKSWQTIVSGNNFFSDFCKYHEVLSPGVGTCKIVCKPSPLLPYVIDRGLGLPYTSVALCTFTVI